MIAPPERSAERDAAIEAMLPHVPFDGWTGRALRRALESIGMAPEDGVLLFPGGAADMVEAFCDWADRRMEDAAAAQDWSVLRQPQRVRAAVALRLAQNRPYKEAVRRALSVLALPQNVRVAAMCTARTVDAVWHAAGDSSSDFSWYTKRAILTGIYAATVLYWLRDDSLDDAATLAFLDRRLAGVRQIGRARQRAEQALGRLRPGSGLRGPDRGVRLQSEQRESDDGRCRRIHPA
jgi:ubiquinone biosynthesis protein COQ9